MISYLKGISYEFIYDLIINKSNFFYKFDLKSKSGILDIKAKFY